MKLFKNLKIQISVSAIDAGEDGVWSAMMPSSPTSSSTMRMTTSYNKMSTPPVLVPLSIFLVSTVVSME